MNSTDFKDLNFSLFGTNSEVKGDLILTGDSIINGNVEGSVRIKGEYLLNVERNAQIQGNIYAHDIVLYGRLEGSIQATGTVTIKSSASITGQIKAAQLSIAPGAQVNIQGDTLETK